MNEALIDILQFFSVKLLEYDKRFATVAGSDFVYYDYKSPMSFGQISTNNSEVCFRELFDMVIADPPFLSEECATKTSVTVKYLAKKDAQLLYCTGNLTILWVGELNCCGLTSCKKRFDRMGGGRGGGGVGGGHCVV